MRLDNKDKLLIEHLMNDCRISDSKLAKILNLKQPSVSYRINQIEKEGLISKYDVIVNIDLLPCEKYIYLISVPLQKKDDFERVYESDSRVVSLFRTLHEYNYVFMTNFKNQKMKDSFDGLLEKSSLVFEYFPINSINVFPFSVFNIPVVYKAKDKIEQKTLTLDEIDIKIIIALSNGKARTPFLQLSKELDIPYDTLYYRYKRLLKANYFLQFSAQPSQEVFTYSFDFLIIETNDIPLEEMKEIVKKVPIIFYLIDAGNGRYITQLLSSSLVQFKEELGSIYDFLRGRVKRVELINAKNWSFLNRYSLTNFNLSKNRDNKSN